MDELELRHLIQRVKAGTLPRRHFIRMVVGAGLTVPMAGHLLMHAGVANAAEGVRNPYKPTKRGGGGTLRLLVWQAPTILNPHFATGTKDLVGSRVFYQALADWDMDGNLFPVLAADIPTIENGGVAKDGRSVTWNLKTNVQWHDGKPFTADDVVFNQEYAADPATAAVTIGIYRDVRVEKLGTHKVRLVFAKPTPFWADAFVASRGLMVPKHLFDAYRGAKSRDAPANLKPVGTGPYKFVDFKPGDSVRGAINPAYHEPNRPFFDALELKGGGDAVSAARAVLQTGEYDYAWNIQVEDEILVRLEQGGKGRTNIFGEGAVEHIQLNASDPWTEVDGERSSAKSKHPILSDPVVREAINLCVDRASVQQHVYGRTGVLTTNFLNAPVRFKSTAHKWEFNPDKANLLLDRAGWKTGGDGIREKGGKKLKFLFQTSTNAPRQKTQAIVKQACRRAGIDLELKSIPASVFFSSDAGNSDTLSRFSADIQMYNWTMGQPDPAYFMNIFCSWEIAAKDNKWIGRNSLRWRNDEFDSLHKGAESELDPVKRAAMFVRMNDLVITSGYVIPIVMRPTVNVVSSKLKAQFSGWSNDLVLLQDWYKET